MTFLRGKNGGWRDELLYDDAVEVEAALVGGKDVEADALRTRLLSFSFDEVPVRCGDRRWPSPLEDAEGEASQRAARSPLPVRIWPILRIFPAPRSRGWCFDGDIDEVDTWPPPRGGTGTESEGKDGTIMIGVAAAAGPELGLPFIGVELPPVLPARLPLLLLPWPIPMPIVQFIPMVILR